MNDAVLLQEEQTQPMDSDLPKWLPERLERAKKSAIQALLHELGFEDAEGLRDKLTSQATQLAQLSADYAALSEQLAAAQAARQHALIEANFMLEAGAYPFISLEEARALVDLSGVRVSEDGQVMGMREAVTALVEARPHLLRRSQFISSEVGGGLNGGTFRPASVGELPAEQLEDLKRRFKLW